MLDLEEGDLRQGLLALVVALLEMIKEALARAAVRGVDAGRLSDAEVERLGDALAELEEAVAQMKAEQGVEQAVRGIRDELDRLADRVVEALAGRDGRALAAGDAAAPGLPAPTAREGGRACQTARARPRGAA